MMNQPEMAAPAWRSVMVTRHLPEELSGLETLCKNLWWCWNDKAKDLFRTVDYDLWHASGHNPMVILDKVSLKRYKELAKDREFLARLDEVMAEFNDYMAAKEQRTEPSVGYFCMEYGLDTSLMIYSGGLGILAGDYLKETSDMNVNLVAVGLLYRFGYFNQRLTPQGNQVAEYKPQDFLKIPAEPVLDENGAWKTVSTQMPGRTMSARIWKVAVGRTDLYLLDTDYEDNIPEDRQVTHQLYGGDWENRLKQEILLGIGGMILLKELGIKKDIYHCNEGHAALCNLQRLCDYIEEGLTFNQAMELVRASGLYTCHTPVPAGHDYFDESLFGKYMGGYPARLGITWDEFIGMGRTNPDDKSEKFSMSTFAINTCQEVNGVSKLHGWVSQKMFAPIWKGYFPEENHVGYVTNGVHFPSWTATEWRHLYEKHFDKNHLKDQSNEKIWHAIYNVSDEEIWETRMALKNKLTDYIRTKFRENWLKNQGDPSRVLSLLHRINPNALMIGFCRRFATYKRAHLLFTDLERLEKIVNDPERPVQFLFSGKAHPADGAGQGLIKRIYEISQRPEFLGKIIFLEDYDFRLARRLVSGVDIWMNTPTRPMEASGTSGEKAEMNGVVNLSVLDGWWLEGYREGAGWALTEKRTYQNQEYQDQLDAATIYGLLENEIIPLYYDKNEKGYSEGWIKVIKNSIATIAPHYTMKRQLDDYYEKFYNKQAKRFHMLEANNYQKAKEIAHWKETVAERWDSIRVVTAENNLPADGPENGVEYTFKFVIDEQGLNDAVGLEFVSIATDETGRDYVHDIHPFEVVAHAGNLYTFEAKCVAPSAGTFKTAVRMYPKNALLPHRQDFAYVKWFSY